MSSGSVIREARERAQLSLRELAERSGTSAATLSNYETGAKEPRWSTVERIAEAAGYFPRVTLDPAPTIEYAIAECAADIRREQHDADRLRVVFELVDRWRELPDHRRAGAVATRPRTTGSPRWDALLGGVVEHLCHERGLEAPSWTARQDRFLSTFWFVIDRPVLRVWALTDTPAALFRRGVLLSRQDLERA